MDNKILKLIKLSYLNKEAKLLGGISDGIVFVHFFLSPSMSTTDSLNEIYLEQLRRLERYIEKKRYNNYLESVALANDFVNANVIDISNKTRQDIINEIKESDNARV